MKEYLLTTDEFLNPKTIEGSEAYGALLIRLLLLEPGTNPDRPEMGVGLGPRYRFITSDEMSKLQTLIQSQIETYLPESFLSTTKAYLEIKNSNYLLITIVTDSAKYIYDTEDSNTPIQLSDMIA